MGLFDDDEYEPLQDVHCTSMELLNDSMDDDSIPKFLPSTAPQLNNNNNRSFIRSSAMQEFNYLLTKDDDGPDYLPSFSDLLAPAVAEYNQIRNNKSSMFNHLSARIEQNLENDRHAKIDKAARIKKLREEDQEMRIQLAMTEADLKEEEKRQIVLDKPVLAMRKKTKKKLEQAKDAYREWQEIEKKTKEKLEKAILEKENIQKLLDRLGISLIQNKTEEENIQFGGFILKKIDPANPDAEYRLLFSDFNESDWSFQITEAQPSFDEFSELAAKYNQDHKLLPFLDGLRMGWVCLCELEAAANRTPNTSDLDTPVKSR